MLMTMMMMRSLMMGTVAMKSSFFSPTTRSDRSTDHSQGAGSWASRCMVGYSGLAAGNQKMCGEISALKYFFNERLPLRRPLNNLATRNQSHCISRLSWDGSCSRSVVRMYGLGLGPENGLVKRSCLPTRWLEMRFIIAHALFCTLGKIRSNQSTLAKIISKIVYNENNIRRLKFEDIDK